MASDPASELGKRERQIMEVVYRRGQASASDVRADLPDPPSYSAVRAMLRYLEDKGYLRHEQDGAKYIYRPTSPKRTVRTSALAHVVQTFFDGSTASAVAALIESKPLSRDDCERLSRLLDEAAAKRGEK